MKMKSVLSMLCITLAVIAGCTKREYDVKPVVRKKTAVLTAGQYAPKQSAGGILFRYRNTGAKKVVLAGDFTGWKSNSAKYTMRKNQNGIWSITIKLAPGTYMYKFVVDGNWLSDPDNPVINKKDHNNSVVAVDRTGDVVFKQMGPKNRKNPGQLYRKYTALNSAPWIRKTVIYEMYFRVFTKEGTIRAAEKKLGYLKDLGVEVLWLMPIFPVGAEKKKGSIGCPYSVQDYRKVNPAFGTAADFRAFVKKAHAMGFKVILDWVANHSAWDNWMITRHPSWYTKKNGKIVPPVKDWWDVADLNYEDNKNNHSAIRKYMRESLIYWVKNFDVDGFRCDVADMVPQDFWGTVYSALKKIKPGILMLAESENPTHHIKYFDLTYEGHTREMLRRILIGSEKAYNFEKHYNNILYTFPKRSLRMRWLENHDQIRATKFFNRTTIYAASAVLFGLDGIPLIYSGQEFGDTLWKNWRSLFDKMTIDWKNFDRKLFNHYKKLIHIRRGSEALSSGNVHFLQNSNASRVITFLRIKDGKTVLVAVNLSGRKADFDILAKNVSASGIRGSVSPMDLITGKKLDAQPLAGMRIRLKPYGFTYLKLK